MAYSPDDARARRRELSRSAWDVYDQLCAFGDPNTGVVESRFAGNARLAEFTALKLGTVKNAMTELRKKGWVEEREGRILLLVGTFLREVRRLKREAAQASPTGDAPSLVNDGDGNKERARGLTSPLTSPETSPETNTHTPAPAVQGARAAPPDGGGVCVSMPRHSKETLRRYGAAHADREGRPLGEGWVTEAFRTGAWNDAVDIWLESLKPEQQARAFIARPAEPPKCPPTCPLCSGAGTEVVPGKGARRCPNLVSQASRQPEHVAHAPP